MNPAGFANPMGAQPMGVSPQAQQMRVQLVHHFQQQQAQQQQMAPGAWQSQVNPMERAGYVTTLYVSPIVGLSTLVSILYFWGRHT